MDHFAKYGDRALQAVGEFDWGRRWSRMEEDIAIGSLNHTLHFFSSGKGGGGKYVHWTSSWEPPEC